MAHELSPDVAAAVAQRREKILARWAAGQRVAKADLDLIADLINAARDLRTSPAASGPSVPSVTEAAPVKLVLETAESSAPSPTYRHSYEHYAETLPVFDEATKVDSRVRKIKRWVRDGRAHQPRPYLPPLDEPSQLAAWWSTVRRRRVPAEFLKIAAPPPVVAGQVAPAEKSPTLPQPTPPAPGAAPAAPLGEFKLDLSTVTESGVEQSLRDLRVAATGAFQAYRDALAVGRADLEVRRRAWVELTDQLRKAEAAAAKLLADRGELVRRDELRAELRRVHASMAGSLRTHMADAGIHPALVDRIISDFFRPLREGRFGLDETLPPPPAPPEAASVVGKNATTAPAPTVAENATVSPAPEPAPTSSPLAA